MKVLAFLLILASCAATIHGRAVPEALAVLTKGLHQECAKETKVSEDILTKGKTGEFTEVPEFKCYLKCLLKKLNFITEDNVVSYDGMIAILPPEFVEAGTQMINECRGTTGTDGCDVAWNLNNCLYKSNPKEYFLL